MTELEFATRWSWIVAGKAHLWAPPLMFLMFAVLWKRYGWLPPGPKHMFLMFGAVLTFYEAKDIVVHGAWHEEAGNASWAMVFAAIALVWVGYDAMKTVYSDLSPSMDDEDETDEDETDEDETDEDETGEDETGEDETGEDEEPRQSDT